MSDRNIESLGVAVGVAIMRSMDATDEQVASALLDRDLAVNLQRVEFELHDRLINRHGMMTSQADTIFVAAREAYERGCGLAESPIEKLLLPWLIAAPCPRFRAHLVRVVLPSDENRPRPRDVRVVPQMVVGRYRLDFAVVGQIAERTLVVAVECDGKDFHRVPDDAVRDRYLASFGIPTVRGTGAEIFARPDRVAQRVSDLFERWIDNDYVVGGP